MRGWIILHWDTCQWKCMMEVHFNGSFMGLYGVGLSVYDWHVIELMTMISEVASLYACNDGSLISSQYPQSAISVFFESSVHVFHDKNIYNMACLGYSQCIHFFTWGAVSPRTMNCDDVTHWKKLQLTLDPNILFENQYFGSFVSVVRPCIDSSLWSLSSFWVRLCCP